jgi:hypothetical protein
MPSARLCPSLLCRSGSPVNLKGFSSDRADTAVREESCEEEMFGTELGALRQLAGVIFIRSKAVHNTDIQGGRQLALFARTLEFPLLACRNHVSVTERSTQVLGSGRLSYTPNRRVCDWTASFYSSQY